MNALLAPLSFISATQPQGNAEMQKSMMATQGFNPQAAQQPQQVTQPRPRSSGLRNFLGNLGDALLVANGGQPIYRQEKERAALGQRLAQYLGADDPQLAEILAENPQAGMELFNMRRDDRRAEQSGKRDDRRIGIAEGQLDLGGRELAERIRSNQAGEALTGRGQDVSANTRLQLAELQAREGQLDRQLRMAIANNDRAAAIQLEQLRQANRLEIARLGGGGGYGEEVTTLEYPGTEGSDGGWFSDPVPATPSRTVRTTRPLGPQAGASYPSQQEWNNAPSGTVFNTPEGPLAKP